MLIHGAWLSSQSWENFADYFGDEGFEVTAPEWPRKQGSVVPLTLEEFTYGFVNTFSPEDAAAAYEKYAVPETGQIFYEAGFANFHLHPPTEVHFASDDRAPLLIVGAEKDNTVPASLSHKQ